MSQTSPESLANLLLSRDPLPPLEPGKTIYSEKVKQDIVALHCDPVIKASLHLANDDLDACHDIVEPLSHDSDASVLHAILHRREGEFLDRRGGVMPQREPLEPHVLTQIVSQR